MNINDSSQFRECTSCQMCGAVCPTEAISIKLNKDGFYRPFVDESKCVECSLCVKSCYKFDNNILETNLANKSIIAAWAQDSSVVSSTTSGGIADLLANRLIKEGYKCIGVKYDTVSNCALGAIASSEEDTEAFKGSKYIQSLSIEVFKTLVKDSRSQKFAVFGLPCQIYAIDRLLTNRKIRDNHVLIDLYCHGCPSLNVWTKYVEHVLSKNKVTNVRYTNFRSKARGWGNFNVDIKLNRKNNEIINYISPKINDPFYELFFSDMVLNDSCSSCLLRSTLEYTDIRLGDFWGKSYIDNHSGVSGVSISTHKGEELVSQIKSEITSEPQEFSNFIPYQSYGKIYKINPHIRQELLGMLASDKYTIEECVSAYHKMLPLKTRFKFVLKNIVKLLPNGLISIIKDSFYRLQGK